MASIRILEDHLVNQIAAGEVIERPAAVLKELVENALDAEASRIRVALRSGGRQQVCVEDNGRGMDPADALMCLERHGTSKIRDGEDLFSVSTLGFRGEALPSIAAVSRLEILTRPEDQEVGTRVRMEGGRLVGPEPAGCAAGTRIDVGQLFFNVPVRRKFLRTIPTELGHSVEAIVRQALIHPQVDWSLEHAGRQLLRAPVVGTRAERAADLLKAQGRALLPLTFQCGELEVEALCSPVGVHQSSPRGALYLYVNGRFVRDSLLRQAVREAYRHLVPKGRSPVVVMEVRLPPEHVDVNIHPSKTEVRFRHGRDLVGAVSHGIREGLEAHGIKRPVIQAQNPAPEPLSTPQSSLGLPRARPSASMGFSTPLAQRAPEPERPAPERPTPSVAPGADARDLLPVPRFQDLVVIGQFSRTYLVCEGGGELILIDQHAAHERVTLHQLQASASEHLGAAQRLLSPQVVELPASQATLLSEHLDLFQDLRLEVEPYGEGALAVRSVPPALAKVDLTRLLSDMATQLAEGAKATAGRDLTEHFLATMACHGSVRAHQVLSPYEMRELLVALDEVDFSVCAHGRPVAIRLSEDELERRFHRS